ncbi:secreted protein of Ly-6 domain 1-like [Heteronotia binoei]|uniref:secreted protein of Ly-6 domain 1-like n=1 Tax=Heteronotia binoei TaxID=13085 RepID=UPI00292ED281|nr:secreted protein of Ly-6 domain 1-like [Heteronotia binoei]
MKSAVCQVLATGFLVLLFFDAVQARECLYCRDLDENNFCKRRDWTCHAGLWGYCFTRKVVVDGKIKWVHRGCAERCINTQTKRRVVKMECCTKDYCNWEVNLWNK